MIKELNKGRFGESFRIASFFALLIWLVHIIQMVGDIPLYRYGILPQTWEGIKGIFLSPFIHSARKWMHIINNTPPLFFGLLILFYFYRSVATRTLLFIYLFTGMLVWLVAGWFPDSAYNYHIGASGVVYGLISFIFWSGVFRRNVRGAVLALIMILMYSGMIVGLFPDADGEVSWQSHLMGGLVGMALAYQYQHILEPDELQHFEKTELEEKDEGAFLPPDTFQKTRQEREWEEWKRQNYPPDAW